MSTKGKATRISLALPDGTSYDVRIGRGILDDVGRRMRAVPACAEAAQVVVISDANVAALYSARVVQSLRAAGYRTHSISIEAGEASKSIEVITELWSALSYFGLSRTDCVLALGGGVVGDTAGFAASTYARGVPFVQVPTSLLAMVDASVGGKTAVNLPGAKNMVGTFHQPAYVHIDVDVLGTLPSRELASGWAELVKTALLADDAFFFAVLEAVRGGAARADAFSSDEAMARMADCIVRAVAHKASMVSEDPLDMRGLRVSLNLGHTYGHAMEALCGFGNLSHGACVAEGIRFAARLAQGLCGASAEFVQAQDELLDAVGCPHVPCPAAPEEVLQVMKHDKKAQDGQVRFVLLRDVGEWCVQPVEDAVLLDALRRYMAE